jgi:thiol peroxidase
MSTRRTGLITAGGSPITLLGPALETGGPAPDFATVVADDIGATSTVRLADTPAAVRVFSILPSVDTSVCAEQARRFDAELEALGDAVTLYTVSVDTPYRLRGFNREHGLARTTGLSDYRPERSFGRAWGMLVEEDMELCRACVVLDPAGVVRAVEVAPDTWDHLDYGAVLAGLREVLASA